MPGLRIAAALLLAAAGAGAVDVPQGDLPKIDGVLEAEEWAKAARLAADGGEALLKASGRVLCIGVRVQRPYAGERIDLQIADAAGKNFSSHAFHPAATVPPLSPYPVAPVIVRRGSYSLRREAPLAPPVSCRFRARVYTEADAWSAEVAVALESLEVSPLQRIVFTLDVVHPAGNTPPIAFAPAAGEAPAQWQTLGAAWPADAPPFLTAEEDTNRAFELALFLETMGIVTRKPAAQQPFSDALDGKKSGTKIDALVRQLDACVAADPLDLFALASRVTLLRRANRLADAWKADEPMWKFEAGRASLLLAGTHRALLIADSRLDEAAAFDLPGREGLREMAEAFKKELAAREHAAQGPAVAFETTKGTVVVELYADAPKAAQALLALVESGALNGAAFDPVTGAAFAEVAPKGAAPVETEGRRLAWRGTLTFAGTGALRFCTAHDSVPAVGRVVEGMDVVDALDAGDTIKSAARRPAR